MQNDSRPPRMNLRHKMMLAHAVVTLAAVLLAEGMALGIGIFILPYLVGGMGAGDVKLMGAVGAVLGPGGVFMAFLATALAGGILALLVMLIHYNYSKGLITRCATTLKTLLVTGQLI